MQWFPKWISFLKLKVILLNDRLGRDFNVYALFNKTENSWKINEVIDTMGCISYNKIEVRTAAFLYMGIFSHWKFNSKMPIEYYNLNKNNSKNSHRHFCFIYHIFRSNLNPSVAISRLSSVSTEMSNLPVCIVYRQKSRSVGLLCAMCVFAFQCWMLSMCHLPTHQSFYVAHCVSHRPSKKPLVAKQNQK